MSKNDSIPLCVDLDGTLVKLDTLHQALFLLLRREPASIFRLPGWIAKGKAHLKDQVMQRVSLDAAALPYHQEFLAHLRSEHAAGRPLVLATASNHRTADAVAEHLGLFSETLSSCASTNLRHAQKLEAIQARFPKFAYAGNDAADFPIWEAAEEVILVNPTPTAKAKYAGKASQIFIEKRPEGLMVIKAMRCNQWLKNLLIFSPMLLAHKFADLGSLWQSAVAFLSFSLAASSIYVLNDLFDLSADQHHPRKCRRPFASGDLPIVSGALMIPVLVAFSFAFCWFLPPAFLFVLLAYYAITTAYSWRIKQVAVADVLTLAVLFSMRIVAGAVATSTTASGWFIEFAIFLFLSLALVKRMAELREMEKEPDKENHQRERGYVPADLPLLLAFGTASGYIAVFVFTLYLNSDKVTLLYSRPQFLWAFCPLLLYWITRIWHLAWRGKMHDDPLAFAAKDPQTYFVGAIAVAAMLYAI
ncbi:UbiA family prenyltransferase [Pontiella sulfatireligans]|uniref:Decaprenyl-phosphate phosphoribosyltransferase n=1 Tax=Pontiella sulfatireligans TaxID=2750658 RepID=A0A6C2ULM3_9BACT|nr:UbiA family prenyltransferase [Pontiella sulfatireligans]VGO20241.1 Decaprenyl-phosphate phosphoribosyltransferase [Pontiella sulfatireligans]